VRYRPPEGATLAELDAGALDPIVTLMGSTGSPGPGSLGCGSRAGVGSTGSPGPGSLGCGSRAGVGSTGSPGPGSLGCGSRAGVGSAGWPGPGSLGCGTGAMMGSAGWPGRGLLGWGWVGWGWVGWGVSMHPLVPLGAAAIRLLLADVDVDHQGRIAMQFQLVVDGLQTWPKIDRSSSEGSPRPRSFAVPTFSLWRAVDVAPNWTVHLRQAFSLARASPPIIIAV
jgi:hypothetical protein